MNSIIGAKIITSLSGVVSTEIITSVITKSIKSTISNISTLLTHTSIPEIHNVKNEIEILDIKNKLEIMHSLIKELNDIELKEFHRIAIKSLNNLVNEIDQVLIKLNKIIFYNKKKYFYSWRSINITNIKIIKDKTLLLNKKFDDLINLLSIKL